MGGNKRWTKEEEQYLKDNYIYKDNDDIATHINRSIRGITFKANQLGLKKYKNYWNSKEIEYLKSLSEFNYEEISKHLNRGYNSVKAMCFKLKLINQVNFKWTEDEIEFIKNNYKNFTYKELGNILGRESGSVRSKLSRIGYKKVFDFEKWTKEDEKIILNLYKTNCYTYENLFELLPNRNMQQIQGKITRLKIDYPCKNKCYYNNIKFDSVKEMLAYKYIDDLGVEINKNFGKFYTTDEYAYNFIPDFIINKNIIVEYYGWYVDKESTYNVISEYNKKIKEKNKYYASLEDYDFIALYPNDLKNGFEGVYNKIKHLI